MMGKRTILVSGRVVPTMELEGRFFVVSGQSVYGPYPKEDKRFSMNMYLTTEEKIRVHLNGLKESIEKLRIMYQNDRNPEANKDLLDIIDDLEKIENRLCDIPF